MRVGVRLSVRVRVRVHVRVRVGARDCERKSKSMYNSEIIQIANIVKRCT